MDAIITYGKLNRWSIYTEELGPVQYIYYDDGVEYWRKGVRDGSYVIDHALTLTGFGGLENTDWENVWSIQ